MLTRKLTTIFFDLTQNLKYINNVCCNENELCFKNNKNFHYRMFDVQFESWLVVDFTKKILQLNDYQNLYINIFILIKFRQNWFEIFDCSFEKTKKEIRIEKNVKNFYQINEICNNKKLNKNYNECYEI